MSITFGQMVPREITTIKTKMPITHSIEHYQKNIQELNTLSNSGRGSKKFGFSSLKHSETSAADLSETPSISDIRKLFRK
ncbi:hypothetical protein [Sulfuricurvum sp.]|uniref:hypothetical protein n=1 Tax=Sulfuricurvum sp. TaxID=2025608 RepID=UPI002614438B|nr:hypothetical protein [Sulfuricurvum sp.]MDD2266164.1 hypothetical protein [Sulfuricurvum sp.]MDD2784535.1 hypothetical protein [Sulfuricurvum sp.]